MLDWRTCHRKCTQEEDQGMEVEGKHRGVCELHEDKDGTNLWPTTALVDEAIQLHGKADKETWWWSAAEKLRKIIPTRKRKRRQLLKLKTK